MKFSIVLMIAALLQVSAATHAQNITLSRQNISLGQLFEEINKQTGYDFLYNKQILANAKPISIDVVKLH